METIDLYDARTLKRLTQIDAKGFPGDFKIHVSFSPDSRKLGIYGLSNDGSGDKFAVRVWDLDVQTAGISKNNSASAVETQIRKSIILNKPTGSSKSPGISVVTAKGICTVRAGSFKTVDLSIEGDTKTVEGKVASRRPFPFCWIDADNISSLDRKPATEAKAGTLNGGDTAYIAYKRGGEVHVHKGTITQYGAFKADFEYSPTQRGIVQVGPVFTTEGQLAGYGVRMDLGNDIKIYGIRRQ